MAACDHCLLEVADRAAVRVSVGGSARVFCCEGCRGIYLLVQEEGLGDYYARRSWQEKGPNADERPLEPEAFAERQSGEQREAELYIDGIRCASCVWLNERILGRTPGVTFARVSYATHRARIRWDPARLSLGEVLSRIRAVGYRPRPYSESASKRYRHETERDLLLRLGSAAFLASQLMIYSVALYAGAFQGIDPGLRRWFELIALVLTAPVLFYSGASFFKNAVSGLRAGRFNMDSLVALGALAAFGYSVYSMTRAGPVYFDTAAMIITLILLGRYLEARARGRASEAVERLAELAPRLGRKLVTGTGGTVERREVPIGELRPGDLLEVLPGAKAAADGVVESGASEVDESLVTGESKPVPKQQGAAVLAGTQNLYGSFVMRALRVGDETTLAAISRAVADAQLAKPRLQALADAVVGVFVPAMLLLAGGTAGVYLLRGAPLHEALMVAVAVLVIACPCSLGLATPIAVLVATGAASARGLLVKGGDVFERLARVTDVVCDKTGTLTTGHPVLREVVVVPPADGAELASVEQVLAMAAALERTSEHAVGHALGAAPGAAGLGPEWDAEGFEAIPGRGVTGLVKGQRTLVGNLALLRERGVGVASLNASAIAEREAAGATLVYVAWSGQLRGFAAIADVVRDEAPAAVQALVRQGLSVMLASGDEPATTRAIGSSVGIARCQGGLSPADKQALVASLAGSGKGVLMVGDGINDAPALGRADVGVAMGRGTDVAIESAGLVLLRPDLRLLPFAVQLGRRTHRVIRQNVFWAFVYNLVAVPLAMAGMLHPIVAAAAMAASSLCVVVNALRLRGAGEVMGER